MIDTAYDLHPGDQVLVELNDNEKISGEVATINRGNITISKYNPKGEIVAELTTAADNCRLHPEGRNHNDLGDTELSAKFVPLRNDIRKMMVTDFVGIAALGNAIVFFFFTRPRIGNSHVSAPR